LRILGPLGLNASRDLRGYDTPKGDKLTRKKPLYRFAASPHCVSPHLRFTPSPLRGFTASMLHHHCFTAPLLHCFTL
jgi:hypothetical protein